MANVFKKSSRALWCVPKASEIPSSPTFRLQGIILPLSKTKRNRCSSSASLSENFQKCWIGYTKKTVLPNSIGLTRKVEEFFYIKKCSGHNNWRREKILIQFCKMPLSNEYTMSNQKNLCRFLYTQPIHDLKVANSSYF